MYNPKRIIITRTATFLEISKFKMKFADFVNICPSLFLKCKIPIPRRARLVINIGNVNIPVSNGLIPEMLSVPIKVLNKSAGNITGVKLIRTVAKVPKKIIQVTNPTFGR